MLKIIAGVDDSPRAADALALAVALARPLDAELVVASVYPEILQPWRPGAEELRARLKAEAHAVLERARAALGDRVRTTYRVIDGGSVPEALQRLAEEIDASLIVVAQTHRGRLRRVAGVAEQLLHGAHCPVAVAPPGLADRGGGPIASVAVAFDGSAESAVAIGEAAAIAAGASLRVVGVFDPMTVAWAGPSQMQMRPEVADSMRQQLRREIEVAVERFASGADPKIEVIDGRPSDILVEVSRWVDLLVCGSRGMGPVASALSGSVSNRLVHSAECAVLAVPQGAAQLAGDGPGQVAAGSA